MHHLNAAIACLAIAWAVAETPNASARDQGKSLIDFGNIRRDTDPDGRITVFRPYDFVWGEWSKGVSDLPHKGVLIAAAKNSGSLGANQPRLRLTELSALDLLYVVGTHNRANHFALKLTDADGTEAEWNIQLDSVRQQLLLSRRIDLKQPDNVKGGTTPGLDLRHIDKWEFTGDWSDQNIEVLLVKIVTAVENKQAAEQPENSTRR
jgi:hypothetical protein